MKDNPVKYISVLILVVTIFSCAVGPNYHQPEVKSPEIFRTESDNKDTIVNLEWWELFHDPVLDTLIVEALKNNKNVLIAASRIEQARAYLGFNKADFGPKVGVQAGVGRTNYAQGVTQSNTANVYSGSAGLNWELDIWGKIRRGNESAKADLLYSFYGKRAVELSLISEVATNYFNLLDYRARLVISQNTYKSRDSALAIIELRYEKGIIPLIDVNQAQVQRSIAKAAIPQFTRFIVFTENNLNVLLGKNPDSILVKVDLLSHRIPDSIPSGIPSELLQRRPDVAQYQEQYRSQNAQVGVAVAMRFPSISLTGLLGAGSTDLSSLVTGGLGWGVGASLTAPLFEWGKNVRRVDMEREKARQALFSYEYSVINAFREVDDVLIEVQTFKEELSARNDRVIAAQSSRELSELRYNRGVTSYLEVIETQRQEFEARLAYSKNYNDVLASYIKFYKALGGGWITPDEQEKYALQIADKENIDVNTIDRDTLIYNGQVVDLHLTPEEVEQRKVDKKAQRKLEKEQRKEDRKNK
jgi:multidrug efflux system outer membrane protein